MVRRMVVVILATMVVVALASAALGAVSIRTQGQAWSPSRVRVAPATRIVWRATAGQHNVRAYGGGWTFNQDISPFGDPTASRVFRRAGTFRFRCRFHSSVSNGVCSGMCGRVRVTA